MTAQSLSRIKPKRYQLDVWPIVPARWVGQNSGPNFRHPWINPELRLPVRMCRYSLQQQQWRRSVENCRDGGARPEGVLGEGQLALLPTS